jgi:hypothetical protein
MPGTNRTHLVVSAPCDRKWDNDFAAPLAANLFCTALRVSVRTIFASVQFIGKTHCLSERASWTRPDVVFYRLQSLPAAPSWHRNLAHAAEGAHDHLALPSDPALRVKSLECSSRSVRATVRGSEFKALTVSGLKPKDGQFQDMSARHALAPLEHFLLITALPRPGLWRKFGPGYDQNLFNGRRLSARSDRILGRPIS